MIGGASVEVSRTFHAPAREVFRAWIEPERVEAWWGPPGFKIIVRALDARVGGAFHFDMISPSGERGAMAGVYLEVEPHRRLVFEVTEHCNCDLPDGEEPQLERAEVRVDFVETAGDTTVRIVHRGLSSDAIAGRVDLGWGGGLECLAEALRA